MYINTVASNLKVKKSFFTKIFNTKFNLGFGTPASDKCSYCLRMRHEIQNAEDGNKKQQLMLELRAHRLRAKAFYTLMKQKQHGSLSFAFDLQQVQPLPKLNIGEAYYARQISFYCFCVTNIEATERLSMSGTKHKLEEGHKKFLLLLQIFCQIQTLMKPPLLFDSLPMDVVAKIKTNT